MQSLELTPKVLVRDLVMELHFGALDQRAEPARAAICRCELKIRVLLLDALAEELSYEAAFLEGMNRVVDVIRQDPVLISNTAGVGPFKTGS